MLVLAAGAAGAVLLVGLLLPDAGNDEASAAPGRTGRVTDASPIEGSPAGDDDAATDGDAATNPTTATDDSAATESTAGDHREAGPESPRADGSASARDDDPAVAAVALLREADRCRTETGPACDDLLADGGADPVSLLQELGSVGETLPSTQLVDEYGDIAVIRATAGSGDEATAESGTRPSEWILVLARTDEKWLVRDVYDVADQP